MTAARIDVHAHYLPDFYRAALLAAGIAQPDGMPGIPAWTADAALAAMDALNVRTALLSISSPGVHFGDAAAARALARAVNETGKRIGDAHPGRFGLFASLPLPDVEAATAEAVYALDDLGAHGVTVESNHHGMYLGDPALEPLYAALDARQAVVFIHPTSPPGAACALPYPRPMLEFMFETTRSVTNLILSGVTLRYPRLRIIVPHAGAALSALTSRIELFARRMSDGAAGPAPDVRAELRKLYYDLAGAPLPDLIDALLRIADPDRVLYGSDWPFTPLTSCTALADALDASPSLSGTLRDAVMLHNAVRLFPDLLAPAEAAP